MTGSQDQTQAASLGSVEGPTTAQVAPVDVHESKVGAPVFPPETITGTLGELAGELSKGTEVPRAVVPWAETNS